MVQMICMRTTLNLDARVVEAAKEYAARHDTTLTALIDAALRHYITSEPEPSFDFELRVHSSAVRPGVDLEDRDALYDLLDERS
jgi:hypothetical protein